MHQSFVTTAPPPHTHTYREGWGIAGLKCRAIECPLSAGKMTGFWHKDLYPREMFYCEGRGKEQSFDLQCAPWDGVYSRARKPEK